SDPSPERVAEVREQMRKTKRYLTQLPEEEADAVHLVLVLRMSLEEAAEVLECPATTLAARVERGVEMCRELARKSEKETEMGVRRRGLAAAEDVERWRNRASIELGWLAGDADGHVALFSSAGGGYVPAELRRDTQVHEAALEAIVASPVLTAARFAPQVPPGVQNTWRMVAER